MKRGWGWLVFGLNAEDAKVTQRGNGECAGEFFGAWHLDPAYAARKQGTWQSKLALLMSSVYQ